MISATYKKTALQFSSRLRSVIAGWGILLGRMFFRVSHMKYNQRLERIEGIAHLKSMIIFKLNYNKGKHV